MNIKVDQSAYGDIFWVEKGASEYHGPEHDTEIDNHKENPDPFLFSDTKIMTG